MSDSDPRDLIETARELLADSVLTYVSRYTTASENSPGIDFEDIALLVLYEIPAALARLRDRGHIDIDEDSAEGAMLSMERDGLATLKRDERGVVVGAEITGKGLVEARALLQRLAADDG